MDWGFFDKEVIPVVEFNSEYFFIRVQRCANLYDKIKQIENWEEVEIGFKKYQVASIEYALFGWDKIYCYVICREKKDDGQIDMFTGDAFKYRVIMIKNRKKIGFRNCTIL